MAVNSKEKEMCKKHLKKNLKHLWHIKNIKRKKKIKKDNQS